MGSGEMKKKRQGISLFKTTPFSVEDRFHLIMCPPDRLKKICAISLHRY
jgi:hypothetical protein